MNFLCLYFTALLLILGIVDFIKMCIKKMLSDNKKISETEIKIPIYGHCENIEFVVRKILFKYEWIKNTKNIKITIINNGADHETLKICDQLRKNYSNISLTNTHNHNRLHQPIPFPRA